MAGFSIVLFFSILILTVWEMGREPFINFIPSIYSVTIYWKNEIDRNLSYLCLCCLVPSGWAAKTYQWLTQWILYYIIQLEQIFTKKTCIFRTDVKTVWNSSSSSALCWLFLVEIAKLSCCYSSKISQAFPSFPYLDHWSHEIAKTYPVSRSTAVSAFILVSSLRNLTVEFILVQQMLSTRYSLSKKSVPRYVYMYTLSAVKLEAVRVFAPEMLWEHLLNWLK